METLTADDVKNITAMQNGAQPAAPPAASAPDPAPTTSQAPVDTPDPSKTQAPPAPEKKDNGTPTGNEPPKTDTPPPAPTIDYTKYGVKTEDELQKRLGLVSDYEKQINELSKYKDGPQFKSERHKLLYEYGSQAEGMELEKARQFFDVVALDLSKASDQRKRFEVFKLRADNQGYTHDELQTLFAEEELEKFGDPENQDKPQTDSQKLRLRKATEQAEAELKKMQDNWRTARTAERTPEDIAQEKLQWNQSIKEQLTDFEGISGIKLTGQGPKGEKLEGSINFKLDPEKQLAPVVEALRDPAGWWDGMFEQLGIALPDNKGFDFKKFAQLVTKVMYHDDLLSQAYQQGLSDQIAHDLKTSRNVQDPAPGGGAPPAAPKMNEQEEANKAAMKAAGMI